jgi:methyl-accepting chemotaxis protein
LLQWNLTSFSQLAADRLLLLAELRRGAMQEYFATADAELRFWSTNPDLLEAQAGFLESWQGDDVAQQIRHHYAQANPNPSGDYMNLDDAGDGGDYSSVHSQMHARARLFVTQRGYYDFFLISPAGNVLYSVEKEADFASNLQHGAWRDSGLAQVFRQASEDKKEAVIALSDMQSYAPSGGAPAMFMGTALHNDKGQFLGVVAFQLPTDHILAIMAYTSGMGDTGETYLVGSDQLMRSDSRFVDESTVLKQVVNTPTVKLALAGEQGMSLVKDYRGIDVMSVYLPMRVGDTRWAVMAEVDREEIEILAAQQRPALAAPLLFFYGLSLWSVWYWQGRNLPDNDKQLADLDFPEGGDSSGFDS